MGYNFEIASIIILLLFSFDFFRVKKFPKGSTKLLLILIVLSFFISIFDFLVAWFSSLPNFPSAISRVTSTLFYILEGFAYYFSLLYIIAICKKLRTTNIFLHILYITPAIANAILGILALCNVIPFSFNPMQNIIGSSFSISYIAVSGFYILLYILNMFFYRKHLKRSEITAIFLFSVIHIVCIACQTFMPQFLLVGFARACAIGLMYLLLERPAEYVDTETSLFNKNALITLVNSRRLRNKPFSIIYINLTNFHLLNNLLSYEKSNKFLQYIANELSKLQPNKLIFKTDKNSMMIVEKKQREKLIIEKIESRFSSPWKFCGTEIRLSANIIKISYPDYFKDVSQGMDLISYLSSELKKKTQNGYLEPNNEIIKQFNRSKQVELALQNALMTKNLMVYYQPLHNAKTGDLYSAEALIRLNDSKLGFIPPSEFIEIAERTGSVVELGEFVFETCCQFLAKYVQTKTIDLHSLEINLSAVQCVQPFLADRFIEIMDKYNVNPKLINLELTETAITSSENLVLEHMQKLKKKGITFSCDDYGTGYSTCSYLLKFPFSQVKFDKTLIDSFFTSKNANIIISNEIKTIKELGFSIVAEGVEKAEHLLSLALRNVDYIQGYYFSRPLPENEFVIYGKTFSFKHIDNLKKVVEKQKSTTPQSVTTTTTIKAPNKTVVTSKNIQPSQPINKPLKQTTSTVIKKPKKP